MRVRKKRSDRKEWTGRKTQELGANPAIWSQSFPTQKRVELGRKVIDSQKPGAGRDPIPFPSWEGRKP